MSFLKCQECGWGGGLKLLAQSMDGVGWLLAIAVQRSISPAFTQTAWRKQLYTCHNGQPWFTTRKRPTQLCQESSHHHFFPCLQHQLLMWMMNIVNLLPLVKILALLASTTYTHFLCQWIMKGYCYDCWVSAWLKARPYVIIGWHDCSCQALTTTKDLDL